MQRALTDRRIIDVAALLVNEWMPSWMENDNTFVITEERYETLLNQVSDILGVQKNLITAYLLRGCETLLMKRVLRLRWTTWRKRRLYTRLTKWLTKRVPTEIHSTIVNYCTHF